MERCFGVWKQRFRCLLRGFSTSLDNTKKTIVALAVLLDIALQMGEDNNNLVMIDDNPPMPPKDHLVHLEKLQETQNNAIQRKTVRAAFIHDFF